MKKILLILCLLCIPFLFTACDDGDDSGSSGGAVPVVSYTIFDGDEWATCYNATTSVIMNPYQTCTWNCATYNDSAPRYWKLTILWDEEEDSHSLESVESGICR